AVTGHAHVVGRGAQGQVDLRGGHRGGGQSAGDWGGGGVGGGLSGRARRGRLGGSISRGVDGLDGIGEAGGRREAGVLKCRRGSQGGEQGAGAVDAVACHAHVVGRCAPGQIDL